VLRVCLSQVQFVDVILVNRYYAWYSDVGHTELIGRQLEHDLRAWHAKFRKPVVMSEYGADTVAGLHQVRPGGRYLQLANGYWRHFRKVLAVCVFPIIALRFVIPFQKMLKVLNSFYD